MAHNLKLRNLVFILLGVLILVFKRYYQGPLSDLIQNHGSNFSVSFATYYIALMAFNQLPRPSLFSFIGSLLAVELFELTNGFGVMTNVYDPWDYLANFLGISLAVGLDITLDRFSARGEIDDEGIMDKNPG